MSTLGTSLSVAERTVALREFN